MVNYFKIHAPLRIDFCGGFTDVEELAAFAGSSIANVAIDLFRDEQHREAVEFSVERVTGEIQPPTQPAHKWLLETLTTFYGNMLDFQQHLRINVDVPISTGLGTSGALCVLLIAAARQCLNKQTDIGNELWQDAKKYENSILKIKGGHQDFISVVNGGYNFITTPVHDFQAMRIQQCRPNESFSTYFNEHCVIVYAKRRQTSSHILEYVIENAKGQSLFSSMLVKIKEYNEMFHKIATSSKSLDHTMLNKLCDCINGSSAIRETLTAHDAKNDILDIVREDLQPFVHCSHPAGGGGGAIVFYGKPQYRNSITDRLKKHATSLEIKYYFPKISNEGLRLTR